MKKIHWLTNRFAEARKKVDPAGADFLHSSFCW